MSQQEQARPTPARASEGRRVYCPQDGWVPLRWKGLHVIMRCGAPSNLLTFFCPRCRHQRFQRLDAAGTRHAIGNEVSVSVLHVPAEALETKLPYALTETWVRVQIHKLHQEDWRPPTA